MAIEKRERESKRELAMYHLLLNDKSARNEAAHTKATISFFLFLLSLYFYFLSSPHTLRIYFLFLSLFLVHTCTRIDINCIFPTFSTLCAMMTKREVKKKKKGSKNLKRTLCSVVSLDTSRGYR